MLLKVMSGSKRGQQLFGVMQAGHLAPHEVVLDILAQVIKITESQSKDLFEDHPEYYLDHPPED